MLVWTGHRCKRRLLSRLRTRSGRCSCTADLHPIVSRREDPDLPYALKASASRSRALCRFKDSTELINDLEREAARSS